MNLNKLFEEHNENHKNNPISIIPYEKYSRKQKRRMLKVKESDLIKQKLKN